MAGSVRRRRWAYRLLAVSLSSALALAAVEGTLRVIGLGYGSAPLVDHPVFHHWHPAAYVMRAYTSSGEFGGFDVHYNADGCAMRDELPPASRPSIVFLGDSFTEAGQVPQALRFSTLVASGLGLAEINFGCSSFSPLLSRLQLEHFADRIRPEIVVLQLYANDVDGDVALARDGRRDARGRIRAVPGDATHWSVHLARRSYLARLLRKQWLSWHYLRDRARSQPGERVDAWSPTFSMPLSKRYSAADLSETEENILDIRRWTVTRGAAFWLWTVPDRGAAKRGLPDPLHDHFRRFAEDHGIAFFDAVDAFRRHSVTALFYPEDIHFTVEGHAVVAEGLLDALGSDAGR